MEKKMIVTLVVAVVAIAALGGIVYAIMNNQSSGKVINSIDDLEGSKIAVETGTTGDLFATDEYEKTGKATLSRYTTYPDAIMDLKNKKVDAIIMDKAPAEAYVKANSGIKVLDAKLDTETESYGFVFKLGNTSLKTEFDTALATIKASGKVTEIETYWFEHSNGEADPFVTSTGTGKEIKVGTSPDFPPYDTMYGSTFTGIDMDIVRAICNELNYRVTFVNYDFDAIITAVQSNAIDVGASGFSITPDREDSVLFSEAYTTTEQVVVVRA